MSDKTDIDDEQYIDALPLANQLAELCQGFDPGFRLIGNMTCAEVAAVARLAVAGSGLSRWLAERAAEQIEATQGDLHE